MPQIGLNSFGSLRTSAWVVVVGVITSCCGTLFCFAQEPKAPAKDDLREIITTAEQFEIRIGLDRLPLEFQKTPVLRWPNATRDVPLGGTFIWTLDGRPEVMACIWEGDGDGLSFAFHSLTSSKLIAQKGEQTFWRSESPGIELKPFTDAPSPADSTVKRLAQMKALTRRFRSRVTTNRENTDELRLLPTPLYRYKTEGQDIIDGALFAFVQGTDPEVILTVEARSRKGKTPEWQYGISRRSLLALEVKLDDKQVWSVEQSAGASDQPFFTGLFSQIKSNR